MMDERKEEAASLYALDLLEGAERSAFEAEMAQDPALRKLVDELRQSSSQLALTAKPAAPSNALRDRVLASVASLPASGASISAPANTDSKVISFPLAWLGWAAAACFAVTAAFYGEKYYTVKSESVVLRSNLETTAIESQSLRQKLEAEQIISSKQVADFQLDRAEASKQTELLRKNLDGSVAETQALRQKLASEQTSSAKQIADLQNERTTAEKQIAQLRLESDLAQLKISHLASLLDSKEAAAVAVAVWNPVSHEGILNVDKLPVLKGDQDYQMWVVDKGNPNPVSGGVFTVDENGTAHVRFRPDQKVDAAVVFAVTRERKGGVPKAQGPFVLKGDL